MYTGKYFILVVLLLAAVTLAVHGHALGDGLFLDDHWHVLRLAENDWSRSAFFESTTIEPDRFMHMWWQDNPISWWYIRPLAILVSKTVYHLSGGSVKALHAVSLLLHLVNALMVQHLVLRMTRRRFWAVVGALLFLVYSHSVYAVPWLASQNALLATTLMLAALIVYARASGLNIYAGPREGIPASSDVAEAASREGIPAEDGCGKGFPHQQTCDPHQRTCDPHQRAADTSRLKWGMLVAAMVLWIGSLLSRESSVVLPFFFVAFDLAFGGWRQVRKRLGVYAVAGVLAAAFLAWRVVFFDHPIPDFYCPKPGRSGYALWWLAKLLHYMTATVWLSPMTIGPTGRINPWSEAPGDCVFMLVILAIMAVGYHMSTRRVRGAWIWPTWILLGLLPIVPIMATPHNGYLPSVGFAIGMVLGAALRDKTRPTSVGRWCPGVAIWFLIATTTYVPIYRPMWYSVLASERMTIEQVMRMPPGPQATDVFFINLPFVNIYAAYQIDEAMGRGAKLGVTRQADPTYRTHTLTYAADLLKMKGGCRVEQLDGQRFRVVADGPAYFSGALGRFCVDAMRNDRRPFQPGEVVRGELFDTTVVRVDAAGVHELEFAFHEPLASPRFAFYVGTPDCAAARVRFVEADRLPATRVVEAGRMPAPQAEADRTPAPQVETDVVPAAQEVVRGGIAVQDAASSRLPITLDEVHKATDWLRLGHAEAGLVLFSAAEDGDPVVRRAARDAVGECCLPVARALAAPVLASAGPSAAGWTSWTAAREWWSRYVDDAAVGALLTCRQDFAGRLWDRDALFRIREIASWVIKTDLYLTGPPFPGPQ